MSASVEILEMTATNSGVDKTSGTVRFKSADETATGTTNRLQIPTSTTSTNYSYTKSLQFYFATAPSVDIQNLRAYTDGTNNYGTGVAAQYDMHTQWATNTNANIAGADLFTAKATQPIDMDVTNVGPHTGTGLHGDALRIQMAITGTASPGTLSAEVLTMAWDCHVPLAGNC